MFSLSSPSLLFFFLPHIALLLSFSFHFNLRFVSERTDASGVFHRILFQAPSLKSTVSCKCRYVCNSRSEDENKY